MRAATYRPTGLPRAFALALLSVACSGGGTAGPDCVPATEICNGIDDDCDGHADEGFGVGDACSAGVGACAGSGQVVCTADHLGTACDAVAGSPSAEACNGIDDDCDGAVDQGDPGAGGACATGLAGVCAAGFRHCTGGALQCVPSVAASTEVCNGLDDDCDGQVDQGFGLGVACTAGVGACARTGALVCDAGGLSSTCSAVAGVPEAEVCANGIDDDCDGETDEGCAWSHTIVMDGVNDFDPATEHVGTTSAGYDAWVTWDATHLYVGYSGNDIAVSSSHHWLLFYVDARSGTAGLPQGVTYNTQAVAFPAGFTGDWSASVRADGYENTHQVESGAWTALGTTSVDHSRRITYSEMKISFVAFGDPMQFGLIVLLVDDTAGSEWTYAGLYPDAFTDGYAPTVQHYLLVDRTSSAAPNAPGNER